MGAGAWELGHGRKTEYIQEYVLDNNKNKKKEFNLPLFFQNCLNIEL